MNNLVSLILTFVASLFVSFLSYASDKVTYANEVFKEFKVSAFVGTDTKIPIVIKKMNKEDRLQHSSTHLMYTGRVGHKLAVNVNA